MPSKEIYQEFLQYFRIEEIVSPGAFQQYKHRGDFFFLGRFDPRLLDTMIFIRKKLNISITINNWLWGGDYDERGLRDNLVPLVKNKRTVYLSGHVLGMAFDFDVEGLTAVEVRDWLEAQADCLPYKIRLENNLNEKPITWVHLDVVDEPKNPKVYRFNI